MSSQSRKEAIREFKERKTPRGIFCVKRGTDVWVGSYPNLDAARNGVWFALRMGSHPNKAMQASWNEHGEDAFAFEVLEKFDEDLAPMTLNDLYKARTRHWMEQLGAMPVIQ
jgi:hypothetical protein